MYRLDFFGTRVNFIDFSVIYVSQGSVATYVRCGGMSTQRCIANFLLSLSVKEFLKSIKIWQSYCPKFGGFLFLEHSVEWYNLIAATHVVIPLVCTHLCRYSISVQSCLTNSHDLGLLMRPRNKCVKPRSIEWDKFVNTRLSHSRPYTYHNNCMCATDMLITWIAVCTYIQHCFHFYTSRIGNLIYF